jgi:hypothetical protein
MRFDARATGIDTAAVYAIADRFGDAAELLDAAVYGHMASLVFTGSTAGRAHTDRGDALRAALDRLTTELSHWSRAAVEVAAAMRASANRYADADGYAAARIA